VVPATEPFILTVIRRLAVAVPVTVNELAVVVKPLEGEVIEIEVDAPTGALTSSTLAITAVRVFSIFFTFCLPKKL
jgi:hypothetical protein